MLVEWARVDGADKMSARHQAVLPVGQRRAKGVAALPVAWRRSYGVELGDGMSRNAAILAAVPQRLWPAFGLDC